MEPFQPFADKPFTMQYYEVPVEILEEGVELCIWAKKALAVAARQPVKVPRAKNRIKAASS